MLVVAQSGRPTSSHFPLRSCPLLLSSLHVFLSCPLLVSSSFVLLSCPPILVLRPPRMSTSNVLLFCLLLSCSFSPSRVLAPVAGLELIQCALFILHWTNMNFILLSLFTFSFFHKKACPSICPFIHPFVRINHKGISLATRAYFYQ